MTANELGDLLAGVFAPAAFILLAVTVVMQAIELRAQRQELEETRDVFSAQNTLIGSQTDAAIKSADLFAAQNDILTAQETARLAEARNTEFVGLLQRIETILRTRLADRAPLTVNGSAHISLFDKRPMPLPEGSIAAIGTAADNALFAEQNRGGTKYQVYDKYGHLQAFQALIKLSKRAQEMAASLGVDHQDIVAEIRLVEFADLLERYVHNGVVAGR
ncbi:hypothetical protein [Ensifer sp. B1-9]|uniref:hypothetical protein n=1 Tax=Ensifer sp. B1-9 TaxID=3141455 RepID=UPI003D219399